MRKDCYTDPTYSEDSNYVHCAGEGKYNKSFWLVSNMIDEDTWSFDVGGFAGSTHNNVDRETLESILKAVQTALAQTVVDKY